MCAVAKFARKVKTAGVLALELREVTGYDLYSLLPELQSSPGVGMLHICRTRRTQVSHL